MEKYGVKKDVLHIELRDEESRLMAEMSRMLGDRSSKTASDRNALEKKLQGVRNKLTELDLASN